MPQALGRLRVALDDAYLRTSRDLQLSPQQAELLCAVVTPRPIGELATVLRCDRSNVSRLVDRASSRGWLKRVSGKEDGRVAMIELTVEGQRLAQRFLTKLESQTDDLRAVWPARRQQVVAKLLEEISSALDAPRKGGRRPK
jgi:DNA-binding MarR family transcriptional regulator